jgi:predicted ArsR family transcriptional regulator
VRERDEETGEYQREYTDGEIRELLRETRLSTREVADALGCHRTTAHERLTELEDEGRIKSKSVGNTLLWELSESR